MSIFTVENLQLAAAAASLLVSAVKLKKTLSPGPQARTSFFFYAAVGSSIIAAGFQSSPTRPAEIDTPTRSIYCQAANKVENTARLYAADPTLERWEEHLDAISTLLDIDDANSTTKSDQPRGKPPASPGTRSH